MNAVHRRAGTDDRVEAEDRLLGMLVGQALHHIDFRADGKDRARRSSLDAFAYEVGRARLVGRIHHLHGALRMDDDTHVGMTQARQLDLLYGEPLVYRAEAVP